MVSGKVFTPAVWAIIVMSFVNTTVATGLTVVSISLEFLDTEDNPIPDTTADGIPDIIQGSGFKLRVLASSADPRGLAGGSIDVTESPDYEFAFSSFNMFPGATVVGDNGGIQGVAPQLNDIGIGTFIFTPGFGNSGPTEFFTAIGTANMTTGVMHFATAEGELPFALQEAGGNIDSGDVDWGSGVGVFLPDH